MGLISSLFCCSASTKDDEADKVHNTSNRTARNSGKTTPKAGLSPATSRKATANGSTTKVATTTTKQNGTVKVAAPASKTSPKKETGNSSSDSTSSHARKDFDDDDDDDNETETIANTNDDSKKPEQRNADIEEDEEELDGDLEDDEESYLDLMKLQEGQAFNPDTGCLLGHKDTGRFGSKKCLVLDLDETLVHSSFKYLRTSDFVIPVEIDNQVHHVYVIKRPGVDEFLRKVGEWFEVVVFTASVAKYGDPLLDKLDIHNAVHHRLFRDSCYTYQGNFIKNLSQLGRPLADLIIIDNSPASYIFHPQHSIPISSWFSDTHDNELLDLLPFLEDLSKSSVDDVGVVLDITL